MNTSLSWLKAYVPDLDVTAQEYTDAMTLSGTKVEGYEQLDADLEKIVIGQIDKIEKHPDADKLVVCQVNVGTETVQIVTGAKNVFEGAKVPVVLDGGRVAGGHEPGQKVPGGIKIKKGMEVTLQEISKAVMPMLAACVAVLLVVTYIPVTSTALPRALAKNGAYSGDSSSGDSGSSAASAAGDGDYSFNEIADYSDLGWEETTWNFACSTTETSTWADGGRKFGELMEKATGGKVKVNIYAADQLTNGNQSEGIQALMNGDPVQISMHSNLIYSAFDPRFNVVSLPFIYDSVEDADAKFDGEAGEKLKEILGEYGLHCMGIAENGFRELTNSVREVKSVDDMKNLKIRVAGSNLLMECYKRWGADATNLNWSETYTALQQNTVEGEENPLPAIDAASVQEVQPYCSMWDAIYDCLFFCINQDIYDGLTPEQQAVVDKAGRMAVEYERYINRSGANEIMNRWEEKNGVTFTAKEDMDIDSFKEAVEGVDQWFVEELKNQGYDDGQELVDAFK